MAPWRIVDLKFLPDARFQVVFQDGVSGVLDLSDFLTGDLSGTVFQPLQNGDFVSRAYLEHGVVTWPGGIDLAPDTMHREISASGIYRVPRWIRKAA